jgi:DNA-directed RNA polymerase subunit RPC12/RpoP
MLEIVCDRCGRRVGWYSAHDWLVYDEDDERAVCPDCAPEPDYWYQDFVRRCRWTAM